MVGVAALFAATAVACSAEHADEVGAIEGAQIASREECRQDVDCRGQGVCALETLAACQSRCSPSLWCPGKPADECTGSALCRSLCETNETNIRVGTCRARASDGPKRCVGARQGEPCSKYGIGGGQSCSTSSGADTYTCQAGTLVWDGRTSEYGMTKDRCLASANHCWSDLDAHCFEAGSAPIRSRKSNECIQCEPAAEWAYWMLAPTSSCEYFARP